MQRVVFIHDNTVEIDVPDNRMGGALSYRVNHEVQFREIHAYLIKKNILTRNFIDLGAWVGDNTIPWAKNIQDIVYAIDPSALNCTFIETVCQVNGIENVKVFNTAISHRDEILSTNESINHCSFVFDNPGTSGHFKVHATTLDALYAKNEISNIGYIHLDVEGMEYKVMVGATLLIEKERPILTYEQHIDKENLEECIQFLKSRNYRIFMINEVLTGCDPSCRNFIAFPNEIYSDTLVEDIHSHIGTPILVPQV
jgi:FkbM family methyltransferase